jgi:hypothetical protein
MGFDNLTPEQIEKAKACTSREELQKFAQEEKLELSLDDLDGAAGGIWEYVPRDDGDERTGIDPANAHEAYKRGEIGYADLDW